MEKKLKYGFSRELIAQSLQSQEFYLKYFKIQLLDPNELEDYGAIHRQIFKIQKFIKSITEKDKKIDQFLTEK